MDKERENHLSLGIMQPYFFPYLGYWQLMNAVDTYVLYDDVAYIKRGWINRNQIKANGQAQRFGISVQGASQNKKINELEVFLPEKELTRSLKTLESAYHKAPCFDQVFPLVRSVLENEEKNLARFLEYENRAVASYLGIQTPILSSSRLEKDASLKAQDKVLDICQRLGATEYINAIGGKELYSREDFAERGIDLRFLRMDGDISYDQGKGDFLPNLSIIDVMMYNPVEEIRAYLERYTLE
ncbi:MAG: WbqC family protein [Clostridiales bacterium]|nr:WbqC family protein [Clostridiales bacterium]